MRLKDLLPVLGVAAATMAFTLALLGPGQVVATDPAPAITPLIAQPKLTIDGCVFALKVDKESYQPGDKPALTVTVTNPTDAPVETSVALSVSSQSMASMFSRRMVPAAPSDTWTKQCDVTLKPGETKTIEVTVEKALEAGHMITISMLDKDQLAAVSKLTSVVAPQVQVTPNNVQVAPATQLELQQ